MWKNYSKYEPLYVRLQNILLAEIEAGVYKPGDKLPSENDLKKKFSVSAITVRRALKNLVDLGLAFSIQGKGTFVSKPYYMSTTGWSFTEQMTDMGIKPSSKVIEFTRIKAYLDVSNILHLKENEYVYLLKRVRMGDNKPFGLETSMIPEKLCPGLIDINFENESLFSTLKNTFKLEPYWGDAEIYASSAMETEAKILNLPIGAPVIRQRRVHFTEDFTPIEYLNSIFQRGNFILLSGRFRMHHTFNHKGSSKPE